MTDPRMYHTVTEFYQQEKNTLDAVYIGPSNVYAFFQAPIAWHSNGITVYPYSTIGMLFRSMKYVIEDVRKTQPDALIILNINGLRALDRSQTVKISRLHALADFMPLSLNKIRMIDEVSRDIGLTRFQELEFYLPIIRFHSEWDNLKSEYFVTSTNGLKGAESYYIFLNRAVEPEAPFLKTDRRAPLENDQEDTLTDLLDYLDNNQVPTLFICVPQLVQEEADFAQINTAMDMIRERGYTCLDLMQNADDIALDINNDYYDLRHTNIHGSIKYTRFLADYLQQNYQFTDKRGDPAFADWDKAYNDYFDIIDPYTLDLEQDRVQWDVTLPAPVLTSLSAQGQRFSLSWKKVPDAGGYTVYRKSDDEAWTAAGDTEADVSKFQDKGLQANKEYTYAVIAWKESEGIRTYGCFSINGTMTGTTAPDQVTLLSLEEGTEGVTISWEPVPDVDGYQILRRVNGQPNIILDEVDPDVTSYTDTDYDDTLPYRYSVRTYITVGDDTIYGYYRSTNNLLLIKPLDDPDLSLTRQEDGILLSWHEVTGASHYNLYRMDNGEWVMIATNLSASDLEYLDTEAQPDQDNTYYISPYINNPGNIIYEYPGEPVVIEGEVKE